MMAEVTRLSSDVEGNPEKFSVMCAVAKENLLSSWSDTADLDDCIYRNTKELVCGRETFDVSLRALTVDFSFTITSN